MSKATNVKNRWLIAACGILIHISIGSVYAWSIFTNPIHELIGWETSQISFAFSLAILFLGFSAAFMGKYTDQYGPRKTGTIASFLFGGGIALTGLAITIESLPLMYASYGVIAGIGLGTAYVTPVSTMMAWFPDRKGLATGMAIMGFGFATLVTGPIATALMNNLGSPMTFYILGAAFFIVIFSASQYLAKPPVGWVPEGAVIEEEVKESSTKKEFSAKDAVRTPNFWMLWIMLFLNITCGISLVAIAAPMGEEMTGMAAAVAITMVSVMGIFNGAGRLAWATISDYIGRENVFTIFFVVDIAALLVFYVTQSPLVFFATICIMMTCYGAGFSCIPAYISDVFGDRAVAETHGYILTAWGIAGLVGPQIISKLHETSGSYQLPLLLYVGFATVGLVLSIVIRKANRKLHQN